MDKMNFNGFRKISELFENAFRFVLQLGQVNASRVALPLGEEDDEEIIAY